tara:strand:- start:279 stop:518 length:240 start_codon:yes stop_codon:yes gene_type:complete
MEIEIYSKTNCVFCDKAKMRLQKHNPKIHMLDQDYNRDDFFKKFPNARTFPQIIIDKQHIGGYFELKKWLDQNSFDEDF